MSEARQCNCQELSSEALAVLLGIDADHIKLILGEATEEKKGEICQKWQDYHEHGIEMTKELDELFANLCQQHKGLCPQSGPEMIIKEDAPVTPENIIPYSPKLVIRNIEALARGTGAKYLIVIKGQGEELVAKRWARVVPTKPVAGEIIIDMAPIPKAPITPEVTKTAVGNVEIGDWVSFRPDSPLMTVEKIEKGWVTLKDGQGNLQKILVSQQVYQPLKPSAIPKPEIREREARYGFLQLNEAEYNEALKSGRYPEPMRYEKLTGYYTEPHEAGWKGLSLAEMFPTKYKELLKRGVPDKLSPLEVKTVIEEKRIPYGGGVERGVSEAVTPEVTVKTILGSKSEGKRLLYRGTRDIPSDEGMYGKGTYFSSSREYASQYGEVITSEVNLQNPFQPRTIGDLEDIGNPIFKESRGKGLSYQDALEAKSQGIRDYLEKRGYDGIILPTTDLGYQEVIVFHPERSVRVLPKMTPGEEYLYKVVPQRVTPEAAIPKAEAKPEVTIPTLKEMITSKTYPRAPSDIRITVFPTRSTTTAGKFALYDSVQGVTFGKTRDTFQEAVEAANKENLRMYGYKAEPVVKSVKGRKLMPAESVSDFDPTSDIVIRCGERTFIVDKKGIRKDLEVQSDVITPEVKANLARLSPEQKTRMAEEIERTPYLSSEGKTERLTELRLNPRETIPKVEAGMPEIAPIKEQGGAHGRDGPN